MTAAKSCPFCGVAPKRGLHFGRHSIAYCITEACPASQVCHPLDAWNRRAPVNFDGDLPEGCVDLSTTADEARNTVREALWKLTGESS